MYMIRLIPKRLIWSPGWAAALAFCGAASLATGGTVTTSDFTEISSAEFVDIVLAHDPIVFFGSVVATPSTTSSPGAFSNWPTAGPADPGSGDGFVMYDTPLVLDFDAPLAAFGVTFYHHYPSIFGGRMVNPATLEVFDGPNGSGNSLGTVSSTGYTGPENGNPDFVAVWSDTTNILSARLIGTGANLGFGVDGYGASMQPVPEPQTVLLLAVAGVTPLVLGWRRRKR
jgi:hypothetical protein